MTNHHILHYNVQGGRQPLPWTLELTEKRVVTLRAGTLGEAVAITRAYRTIMNLVDMEQWDANVPEALRQLETVAPGSRPVMIALLRFEPTDDQRRELIEAGVDGIIGAEDPPRFLLWQIDLLARFSELAHFQETQMDVNRLAAQTRERLHDLSQPLSAVQGRLQLLAAKCDKADPNAQCFRDMVRLIFDVSNHLMEIQRLHRVYS